MKVTRQVSKISSNGDRHWVVSITVTSRPRWWEKLFLRRQPAIEIEEFYSESGIGTWLRLPAMSLVSDVYFRIFLSEAIVRERAERSYVKAKEYIR